MFSKWSCDTQSCCLHLCSQLPADSGVKNGAAAKEEICVCDLPCSEANFSVAKRGIQFLFLKEYCISLIAEPNVFLHQFPQFIGTILSPLFALYLPFAVPWMKQDSVAKLPWLIPQHD